MRHLSTSRRERTSSTIATLATAGIVAVAASVAAPGISRAEPANDADRIGGYVYDVGVLRPAGILKTVFGAVFWIPAYPLALGSEQRSSVTERLVTEPAKDTFTRPLGEF